MASLLLLLAADAVVLGLEIDREAAHPGEYVQLEGVARATAHASLASVRELAIRGPDGATYRRRLEESGTRELAAGREERILRLPLRIDPPRDEWTPGPPPLRGAGEWTAWLTVGDLRSNDVSWTVRDLRPEEVRRKPTAEQLAALKRLRETAPAHRSADLDLLRAALRDARSDGLARHVVDLLAEAPESAADRHLVDHLAGRAAASTAWAGPLQFGIDGTYLRPLAERVLEAWEVQEAGGAPNRRFLTGLDAVVAWVHFHPEDEGSRERLLRLSRKSARIVRDGEPRGAGPLPIVDAWRILIELGVLRPGMTLEDAVAIVGEPDPRRSGPGGVSWYLDTPRHVNPGLGGAVEDGRITGFRIFRG